MIPLTTRTKEAIKTALAMTIAYAIALQMDWDRPYWAAFAVGMISLPAAGASLRKGVLRMSGTLVAGVAALTLIALFSQQRWWFMIALSVYLGFFTYMMMGKKNQYFYQVCAFVCVVICFDGAGDPVNSFQTAVVRIQETSMGIMVYSLVIVFLWPINTRDELNKVILQLITAQRGLFKTYRLMMTGEGAGTDFRSQSVQTVQLLTQLEPVLDAAEADSYDVWAVRHQWRRVLQESKALMETLVRFQAAFPDIEKLDLHRLLPNVAALGSELEMRFELIQGMLAGEAPVRVPQSIPLVTDKSELATLSSFEKAALAVTKGQIERLESLSRGLFDCIENIKGFSRQPLTVPREEALPAGLALDPDRMAAVIRVISGLWLAFFIWVYIDPPGHDGFVVLSVSLGLGVARFPQLRVSTVFLPVTLSCLFAAGLYILVMPHLAGYIQLGTMIFAAIFGIAYLFSEPGQALTRKLALVFFPVIISISNQQTYSFGQAANTTLEAVLVIALLVVTWYIPYNRQPEKMFLRMLRRFFRQAGFLVSPPTLSLGQTTAAVGWWERLRRSRNDFLAIPDQLGTWGAMVEQRKYVGGSPEQLPLLATRLHMLGHRLQELLEARRNPQAQFLVDELSEDIRVWRFKMQEIFQLLAEDPAAVNQEALQSKLDRRVEQLEVRIKEALNKADEGQISDRDSENFYHLIGAYRGVSEAAVAYAGVSGAIDWKPWYEERF
jgi:uncharacterized membrane protein YccC